MNRISDEHAHRNENTRDAWSVYAAHRQIVTEHLLRGSNTGRDRLCVLGAGNLNDLDLASLVAAYREVHLFDLDEQALRAGLERQSMTDAANVQRHGGVDLSGVLETLAGRDIASPASDDAVQACIHLANAADLPYAPAAFDVVASTCVLTQLIDSVAVAIDASHERFLELLLAVRNRHLRMLVELTAPGGLAMLVTDVVSSDTCAPLATVGEAEFSSFVARTMEEGNFFTGVHPLALKSWFETDPAVSPLVDRVQLVRPWRWSVGPRVYAVCAVKVQRRA